MYLFLSTLLSFAYLPYAVHATTGHPTDTCNPAHNGLATGTLQYVSDCNSTTWCTAAGSCIPKGCRRDEFPLGYPPKIEPQIDGVFWPLPDKCNSTQFCPDEGSDCQNKIDVGGPCQLDRDDSCVGPPNFVELRDTSGRGLNVNGSICLNFICQWANASVSQPCEIQNVGYIAYGENAQEFVNIVSRDTCRVGLYCDTTQKQCFSQKNTGDTCAADKECSTFNCEPDGTCGKSTDASRHFGIWIYIVIGVGIFGGMIGTLILLFFLHGSRRDTEREKRLQYWREQNAFRQNILQMRETARASVFSTPGGAGSRRSALFGTATEDSAAPMLSHAQPVPRGSGLRYYVGEDGSYEDGSDGTDNHRAYDTGGKF